MCVPATGSVPISRGARLFQTSQTCRVSLGACSENSRTLPFVETSSFSNLKPIGVLDSSCGCAGSDTS